MTAWLWQVFLHSTIAGVVLFAWSRHLEVPPGIGRRRLLTVVLVLPLFTAAVPGRTSSAFRSELSWFDGMRLLELPVLPSQGWLVGHGVVALAFIVAAIAIVQEIVPAFVRPGSAVRPVPHDLEAAVRSTQGWENSEVGIVSEDGLGASLDGSPARPRILLSEELISRLDEEELRAVIRHEQAHRGRGHWSAHHLLFLARALQLHNPIALWAFREYCVEVEIECDRLAVEDRDPRPLIRALLALYDDTDPRDVASRRVLQRRVDVLLGRRSDRTGVLPAPGLVVATILLGAFLPWLT